jgi:glycosidase
MRSKSGFGGRRKPRILSLVLSALIFVPNNPFVASAAAQVFDAAVGAARGGAATAVGVSAAPGNIRLIAPLSLDAAPTALSAPLSAAAEGAAPSLHPSPWNPARPTALSAAVPAGIPAAAAPASGLQNSSGLSDPPGLSAAAPTRGPTESSPHSPAAAEPASKDGKLDAMFDGVKDELGWNDLLPVPAEAPNSLAEISLEPAPNAAYTASPKDWRREIVTSVLFDRYGRAEPHKSWGDPADATTRHGGNIRGLIERLPYLKTDGYTTLIINPVYFTLPAAYHGYWPLHFMAVDPHLGTMADFKELVAEAHKLGMRIVLDMVFNHSGPVITYNEGYEFGHEPKTVKEWKFPLKPVELASAENFHRRGSINDFDDPEQTKYGDFPGGLNQLATERPETQDHLLKIAKWWLKETDVDGFRLDTYMHVADSFWDRFHAEIPAYAKTLGKENFLTIGEIYHGDARVLKPEIAAGRLGAAYNYPSYFGDLEALHARAPTRKLEERFSEVAGALGPLVHKLLNFVDLQDKPRFLEDTTPVGLLRVAMAYVMFSVGIPFVYYGTEQAFRRAATNNDVGLDAYREDMFPGGRFRSMGSSGDDFNPESEMYRFMQQLATTRKAHEALMVGEQYVRWSDPSGPGIYAISRIHDGEEVVVVLNTSGEERGAEMPVDTEFTRGGTVLEDALDHGYRVTARQADVGGSKISVVIPAHGVRVLVRK